MHSLKVLVLEDSPFQLMAMHQMLNACSVFDVLTAESVEVACQCLENRGAVDIAVCDLQMDGKDGLAFIRHLAGTHLAKAVIICSSVERSLLDNVAQLARQQGLWVLGVLSKPASPATLHPLLDAYQRGLGHIGSPSALPTAQVEPLACLGELRLDQLPELKTQWVAHYQPKLTMDGKLLGVEALVRWQHPRLGLLLPDRFLAQLEHAGLTDGMTWHMLESALRLSASLRSQGRALPVAVNIAPTMLEHPGFCEAVANRLKAYDLPPGMLTLEVLESREIQTSMAQVESLLRLRMAGCQLSIDDFGRGDSNLQRLLELPFSELKIASEFVRGLAIDGRKAAVVAGALTIAKRMALRVVIEGVETIEDFHALKQLGSPAVQGFYFARPMAAEQLVAWMADREPRLQACAR